MPEAAPVLAASSVQSEPETVRETRRGWRHPVALVAAAAVVVLAAVGGVVALSSGGSGGSSHAAASPKTGQVTNEATVTKVTTQSDGLTFSRAWKLSGTKGDHFTGTVALKNPTSSAVAYNRVEVIPKSLAKSVTDITFSPKPTEVVKKDPVVRFKGNVAPNSTVTITYEIDVAAKGATEARVQAWIADASAEQSKYDPAAATTTTAAPVVTTTPPPAETTPPPPAAGPAPSGSGSTNTGGGGGGGVAPTPSTTTTTTTTQPKPTLSVSIYGTNGTNGLDICYYGYECDYTATITNGSANTTGTWSFSCSSTTFSYPPNNVNFPASHTNGGTCTITLSVNDPGASGPASGSLLVRFV